ncbi:MAG: hypothetical protein R3B99_33085 [Polyangiales bacterium]
MVTAKLIATPSVPLDLPRRDRRRDQTGTPASPSTPKGIARRTATRSTTTPSPSSHRSSSRGRRSFAQ